ncbi:MAG: 2-oxo acid dehydrogenase subunit E2 [Saprospiraceae bacterium]|nr:2-oxo acid dehydrogenase subunit E2 [Saprospiraceae bacterium]
MDSKILGSVDFDVTEVEDFVNKHRRDGLKITLTHVFLLALARGVKQAAPEINCYVRRGKIIQRHSVDVSLSVLANGGQMTSIKIPNAENLSLSELLTFINSEILSARKGQGKHLKHAKNMLLQLPWPFRQWTANLVRCLTIDLGVSIPFLGVSPDSFGTFMLSNLGSIGLDVGYAALAPFSNVAMVVTQGRVTNKPMVVNGQVLPRRAITISAALDHRVVDAAQIGRLFNFLRRVVKNPEMLEKKP